MNRQMLILSATQADNIKARNSYGQASFPCDMQAQVNDESALEITLHMAMEPELRLRFSTYSQYCDWKAGLEVIRQLLEGPYNPLSKDARGSVLPSFAGTEDIPHGLLRTLLLEGLVPGRPCPDLTFTQKVQMLSLDVGEM